MKRTGRKWAMTALCSLSVVLFCGSVGNAGIVPWAWNVVFGPHCPKNKCCPPPACAPSPCGPSGCGVQSAFFTPSSCSSCGSSVCGVFGCETGACGPAGCPTGQCGISSATPERTRTFVDDTDANPEGDWGATKKDAPEPGAEDIPEVEAKKVPIPPKSGAAPTPENIDSKEGANGDGEAEEASEKDGAGGPRFRNHEGSVAWRPATGRTRLKRRATYASARIIRKPRHAKGKWIAVPSTENIAKR